MTKIKFSKNYFVYLFFSVSSRLLYKFGIINKNNFLFQKKRQFLLKIVPDQKLLAQVGAVGHGLYHPKRTKEDIKSVKNHLRSLLKECEKRGFTNHKRIKWARKILDNKYDHYPLYSRGFTPNLNDLKLFEKIVRKRKTIRHVTKKKFNTDLIKRLLSSAVEAPCSCDRQSWRFVIVDKKKEIEKLASIKRQRFIKDFPYVVVACFNKTAYLGTDSRMTPYLDCGAAIMNLCNAASSVGIASSWLNFTENDVGKKKHGKVKKLLNLNDELVPVSLIGLGIPKKKLPKPARENVEFYIVEKNGKNKV